MIKNMAHKQHHFCSEKNSYTKKILLISICWTILAKPQHFLPTKKCSKNLVGRNKRAKLLLMKWLLRIKILKTKSTRRASRRWEERSFGKGTSTSRISSKARCARLSTSLHSSLLHIFLAQRCPLWVKKYAISSILTRWEKWTLQLPLGTRHINELSSLKQIHLFSNHRLSQKRANLKL